MILARHASSDFNDRMTAALQRLTADLLEAAPNLQAVLLGGGYGRGEGGVIRVGRLEQPYNDLDLVIVVRSRRPRLRLEATRRCYEAELGIEVDFSRPVTVADIRRWPHWLMWFDLLHGHTVLAGPPSILTANAPDELWEPPPPIEATRLLLNRGAGLLWAMRVADRIEEAPDGDFVRRNYYKCALALGDAALIVSRRFTTTCNGRDFRLTRLLRQMPIWQPVVDLESYRDALSFKLCPDQAGKRAVGARELRELAQRWGELFLRCEQLRTGRSFASPLEYSRWHGIREADESLPPRWPRNLARNLEAGRFSIGNPRDPLFRELPLLLLSERGTNGGSWAEAGERFLAAWRLCN